MLRVFIGIFGRIRNSFIMINIIFFFYKKKVCNKCELKRNIELEGLSYVFIINNIFVFGKNNLFNSIMYMVI